MELNIDAGEREKNCELDLQLLECADALNIALGGHAGNATWSQQLAKQANDAGCVVHLHPGYPDRENFGRIERAMDWAELSESLSQQREVLPEVTICKFHGALYNQAVVQQELAARLVEWSVQQGIETLLTPDQSALFHQAVNAGLRLKREGFADRQYTQKDGQLQLVSRKQQGSLITQYEKLQQQVEQLMSHQQVRTIEGDEVPLVCETLCLHGDHPEAISNARKLKTWIQQYVPQQYTPQRYIAEQGAGDD